MNARAPFQMTPILYTNLTSKADTIIHQGGTSSGKTYSNLQYFFIKALKKPRQKITVVGQDIPNLKSGSISDLETILYDIHSKIDPSLKKIFETRYNSTDKKHYLCNGTYIEFKSYDNWQDAKNGKRDYLFANELNGIDYKIFEQLHIRTSKQTIVDFNADGPFYAHEKLNGEGYQWCFSNYKDNPFVNPNIVKKILSRKNDKAWFDVYGLGKTGQSAGVIFKNVTWLKEGSELPEGLKQVSYGLDFGYVNDPTVLIKTGYYDGALYGKVLLYEHSLTNPEIAAKLAKMPLEVNARIYCDSAEPKSIKELNNETRKHSRYYKFVEAVKGTDSVRNGVNHLLELPMRLVYCDEWKSEQLNYKWSDKKTDRNGRKIPVDNYNHIWDSMRYARSSFIHKSKNKLLGFAKGG